MTEPAVAPPDHLVKTPKGNVFVREIPGDDPPIVLMHGFPNDHNIYDRLLPLLSPIPAAAFDWRGYGRSERAQLGGFSLQEHASDLEGLLDQLDMFDSLYSSYAIARQASSARILAQLCVSWARYVLGC